MGDGALEDLAMLRETEIKHEIIDRCDPALGSAIRAQHGFVTEPQLKRLKQVCPTLMLLVRCGNGRFLAKAQDVQWFVDIITKEGTDYVRDVSVSCPSQMR